MYLMVYNTVNVFSWAMGSPVLSGSHCSLLHYAMTNICVALQAFQFFSPGSGPSSPLRTPEYPMWSCEPGLEVGSCDGRAGRAGQAMGCDERTGQGQEWD